MYGLVHPVMQGRTHTVNIEGPNSKVSSLAPCTVEPLCKGQVGSEQWGLVARCLSIPPLIIVVHVIDYLAQWTETPYPSTHSC